MKKKHSIIPIIWLCLSLFVGVFASWYIINHMESYVPSEYFPFEVDETQMKVFNGKHQDITIDFDIDGTTLESSDLSVKYFVVHSSYNESTEKLEYRLGEQLTKAPRNVGVYLAKIYKDSIVVDSEGNPVLDENGEETTTLEEVSQVKYIINKRKVTVIPADYTAYFAQNLDYKNYVDQERAGYTAYLNDKGAIEYYYENYNEQDGTGLVGGHSISKTNEFGLSFKHEDSSTYNIYSGIGNYNITLDTGSFDITNTESVSELSNYEFVYQKGTLTVNPLPVTFTWNAESLSVTYNGNYQRPKADFETSTPGVDLTTALSANEGLDLVLDTDDASGRSKLVNVADSTTVTYKKLNNENYIYEGPVLSTSFEIKPMEVDINWENKDFTYNGSYQMAVANITTTLCFNYKDNKQDSVNLVYENENGNINANGTITVKDGIANITYDDSNAYKSVVTDLDNSNYKLKSSNVLTKSYFIKPKLVNVTWNSNNAFEYDKDTHNISATLNTLDLCGSDSIELAYDHETNSMVKANYVDANTPLNSNVYYSNIINDDITNYYFSSYRSEYKIYQKTITITWDTYGTDTSGVPYAKFTYAGKYTDLSRTTFKNQYAQASINAGMICQDSDGNSDVVSLAYTGKKYEANYNTETGKKIEGKADYVSTVSLEGADSSNYKIVENSTCNYRIYTSSQQVNLSSTLPEGYEGQATYSLRTAPTMSYIYNALDFTPKATFVKSLEEQGFIEDENEVVTVGVQMLAEGADSYMDSVRYVGTYQAETRSISNSNYTISETQYVNIIINPKPIEIKWFIPVYNSNGDLTKNYDLTFNYDATKHIPSVEIVGLCSADTGLDETNNPLVYVNVNEAFAETNANKTYTNRNYIDSFDAYNVELVKDSNDSYYLSGLLKDNYIFKDESQCSAKFDILQAPLTISSKVNTITYGDAPSINTNDHFSVVGLMGIDNNDVFGTLQGLDYEISYHQFDDVTDTTNGVTYKSNWTGVTNTNYEITYNNADFIVNKKNVTISWDSVLTHVYNGEKWAPEVSITGLVNNDQVLLSRDDYKINSNAKAGNTNYTASVTGTYSTDGKYQEKNYYVTNIDLTASFTITPRPVTVNWTLITNTYSSESWFPTYTFNNIIGQDKLDEVTSGAQIDANASVAGNLLSGKNNYTATITSLGNLNYKLADSNDITNEESGVTAVAVISTEFYIKALGISVDWNVGEYTYNGKEQLPTVSSLATIFAKDSANVTTTTSVSSASNIENFVAGVWAGSHTAIATLSGSRAFNYEIVEDQTQDYDIAKAPLTITNNAHTIIYGALPANNGYAATGFVNGETVSVLSGELAYTYTYSQYEDIGNYDIESSGFESNNYEISYVKSILTVDPRPVTITWDVAASYTYNGQEQAPTASVTNLVNEDTCTVTVKKFTNANINSEKHTTTPTALSNSNYTLIGTSYSQEFTILPKPINLVWSGHENLTYNAKVQTIKVESNDIVDGETVDIKFDYTTGEGKNAGEHTVKASITNTNYVINENETLKYSIAKKEVTIVWDSNNRLEYNAKEQILGAEFDGLIEGDACEVKYTGKYKNIGTYSAKAYLEGESSSNYEIKSNVTCSFIIYAKTITISWTEDASFVYNRTPQQPIGTLEGLIAGDDVTTKHSTGETNVGDYEASIALEGESAGNYVVATGSSATKSYSITPKPITITWSGVQNLTYNGQEQKPTASSADIISGDTVNYTVSFVTGEGKNAGDHKVIATIDNSNYIISEEGELTYNIAKLTVTISWGALEHTYDKTLFTPTATVSNLVSGDTCELTVTGGQTDAGIDYEATVSDLDNDNYQLPTTGLTNKYTITPREVTMTWSTTSDLVYSGAKHPFTVELGNVVNNEIGYEVTYQTEGVNADKHTVIATLTGTAKDNYIVKTGDDSHGYTIKPRTITVSWDNTSFEYTGEEKLPEATAGNLVPGEEVVLIVSGAASTAGSHKAIVTSITKKDGTINTNYQLPADEKDYSTTFTISNVTITITITIYGATITYGDNLPELSTSESNKGKLFYYTVSGLPESVTLDSVVTGTLTIDTLYEQFSDKGKYSFTASGLTSISAQYEISYVYSGELVVNPYPITSIEWDTSLTYNGANQLPTATFKPLREQDVNTVAVAIADSSVTSYKNANTTYTAKATASNNTNYVLSSELLSSTKDYSISPKEISITWTGDTNLTYNGGIQKPTATAVQSDLVSGESVIINVTLADSYNGIDATTQYVNALSANSNYVVKSAEVLKSYTISKKSVTLTWSSNPLVYSASAQHPTATTTDLIASDNITLSYSNGNTKVGDYSVTASLSGARAGNYAITNASKDYEITPYSITITWGTTITEYDFDGTIKSFTATLPTLLGTDTATLTVSAGQRNANADPSGNLLSDTMYSVTATIDNPNYTISNKTFQYKIKQVGVTISWDKNIFEYNGGAQSPIPSISTTYTGIAVSLNSTGQTNANAVGMAPSLDSSYILSGKSLYTATATLTGTDAANYSVQSGTTCNYIITRKVVRITWEDSDFTYGETLIHKFTYSGFISGDNINIVTEYKNYSPNANADVNGNKLSGKSDYIVSAKFDSTDANYGLSQNYELYNADSTFVIKQYELKITWKTDMVYNGSEQVPFTITNAIESYETANYQFSYGGRTIKNAVTYSNVTVTVGNSNYVILSNNPGTFTIAKLVVKLNTKLYEQQYTASLTWSAIQATLKDAITFVDPTDGTTEITLLETDFNVSGMHNGLYGYGTTGISTLETAPSTYLVGSTYQVIIRVSDNISINGNNYFIFKYKTAIVGGTYYTIEDAISQSGTITFAGNLATSTDINSYVATSFSNLTKQQGYPYAGYSYTINNRKLLVPYGSSSNDYTSAENDSTASYVYSALIIPSSVSLNLTGTASLVVAAEIRFKMRTVTTNLPDTTFTGSHGVVMNYGTIDCSSGTNVYAYGYIKGTGNVYLRKGSTATDCIKLFDWVGGSAISDIFDEVFPSNAWVSHNISCKTYIYSNAQYRIYVFGNTSIMEISEYGYIIGDSNSTNCVFKPSSTAKETDYIIKYAINAKTWDESNINYNALNTITGSNQIMGQKDVYDIHGDYQDSTFKITKNAIIMNVTLQSSTNISMPFGYTDVILSEGTVLNLSNADYSVLPGSSITINKGAVANINANVDVSLVKWNDVVNCVNTDGGFGVHCVDKEVDGKLIVNGELNVVGNIGGIISTADEGALITISGGTTAKYTMLTSSAEGQRTIAQILGTAATVSATGNIKLTENSSFTTGAYISAKNTDGTYYWNTAENVKEFKFKFYDSDKSTILGTKSIYVILESANATYSYTFTGGEFVATKLHYDFVAWTDSSGNVLTNTTYTDATNEIAVYASWTEHEYEFTYTGGYTIDGTLTDVTSDMSLPSSASDKFTISDFVDGTFTLPTATYSYDGVSKSFNNWYIGIMTQHTDTPINSITRAQFDALIEEYGTSSPIPLYTEFTNVPKINVTIVDEHNMGILTDGKNELGFSIEAGTTLADNDKSITLQDSIINSINDSVYEMYYFAGFRIDSNITFDTYQELLEHTFEDNETTVYVHWVEKRSITYITGTQINVDLGVLNDFSETVYYYIPKANVSIIITSISEQGHTFVGWTTSRVTDGTYTYANNTSAINTSTFDDDVTLYASYNINSYTITLYNSTRRDGNGTITYADGSTKPLSVSGKSSTPVDMYYGTKFKVSASSSMASISNDGNLSKDNNGYYIVTTNSTFTISASCFAEGTLITLADGTKKKVEDLKSTDILLVFNHNTGTFDKANATFLIHQDEEAKVHRVINMMFSDGTKLRIVGYHGLYDLTVNDYVYISEQNINEYLGHKFYTENGDRITLSDYYITEEFIKVYSPISNYHVNCFAEGILTASNLTEFMMNLFDYNDDMTYDKNQIAYDISIYGLTTYEDFADHISYEMYCMFPAEYMNIAMGKGLITREGIIKLINEYLIPYQLK